ncbi:uncharacterized protein B0T15DRAFT_497670 [Chaetomium strumarium]|uniref:Cellobiose dehydrogenase-like cytochrome domain-containing protein n=1 Tax=Chaetomium strumarium TaxID=1170767 RepID=A0AAJ0H048_9PEZI|nr:hypothetical protein B0T15DRAFT_497670 [Chaetomium strumarium]
MHALSRIISVLLLLLSSSEGGLASPALNNHNLDLETRQSAPAISRYCNPATSICYLQYTWTPTVPVFRVAIPDTASTSTPFDTLLQITAPSSLGWVGFSWGGRMTLNPLTVVWPNGNSATVSSRWANTRTQPSLYPQATYRTLSASRNATHWTVEAVCSGCSAWSGGSGGLNPSGARTFAWAVSKTAVPQPANTASSFSVHDSANTFQGDLSLAKVPKAAFDAYVRGGR